MNPAPHRIAKTRLTSEQLANLRRFYARHGHNHAVALLKSSKATIHTLMSGGFARSVVVGEIVEKLARAS